MVRINKVYTRTGDDGTTGLVGGARVGKDDDRIEAYGTVDELNAQLGVARTLVERSPSAARLGPILLRVQNELFNLGAELATPDARRKAGQNLVGARHIEALEHEMDALNEDLPDLTSFILPGGGEASSALHVARTVCRRAERRVIRLNRAIASFLENVNPKAPFTLVEDGVRYLNRLSDALFVMGRWAAKADGQPEPLWAPEKA